MKKTTWLYALAALILISVSKPSFAQTPAVIVPDFTFFKLDGSAYASKQMPAGKASLFLFFDVTCEHCQRTMKTMSKHYADLKNIPLYLVTLDRKDAVLKFMDTYAKEFIYKPNITVLIDKNYEFIPKFQPLKYPSAFLFNRYKRLERYEGDENKMLNLIAQVKKI